MSLSDLKGRHLRLVSLYEARYAVRGGTGLVFLLLVLSFGLVLAQVIISPIEQLQVQLKRERGTDVPAGELLADIVSNAKPLVEWFLLDEKKGDSAEVQDRKQEQARRWSEYVLDDRPALLSAIFLLMLFAVPMLVAVGCFNQYSGDVQTRGIRYQLLRTERANIYFGRFLGSACYALLVMLMLIVTIVVYVGLKLDVYEWSALMAWSAWGFLALAVLTLPYVALSGWISASIDSPFASLTITSLIVGGVPLFAALGKRVYEQVEYVKYVIPWGIQNYLMHFDAGYVLLACLGCLFYTALFLALGYRHFAKRDL